MYPIIIHVVIHCIKKSLNNTHVWTNQKDTKWGSMVQEELSKNHDVFLFADKDDFSYIINDLAISWSARVAKS